MQQSVIYQEWREEFLPEGERSLILRLFSRRIGDVTSEMRSHFPLQAF